MVGRQDQLVRLVLAGLEELPGFAKRWEQRAMLSPFELELLRGQMGELWLMFGERAALMTDAEYLLARQVLLEMTDAIKAEVLQRQGGDDGATRRGEAGRVPQQGVVGEPALDAPRRGLAGDEDHPAGQLLGNGPGDRAPVRGAEPEGQEGLVEPGDGGAKPPRRDVVKHRVTLKLSVKPPLPRGEAMSVSSRSVEVPFTSAQAADGFWRTILEVCEVYQRAVEGSVETHCRGELPPGQTGRDAPRAETHPSKATEDDPPEDPGAPCLCATVAPGKFHRDCPEHGEAAMKDALEKLDG